MRDYKPGPDMPNDACFGDDRIHERRIVGHIQVEHRVAAGTKRMRAPRIGRKADIEVRMCSPQLALDGHIRHSVPVPTPP